MRPESEPQRQRLDKWLWAARFFKTRRLAVEAISGGKVQLNGQRTKPGREVQPGSRLRIHKESLEWEIEVLQISRQRRPAAEARHFYREEPHSLQRRQQQLQLQRDQRSALPATPSRPSKRDRRMIHRFTGREE